MEYGIEISTNEQFDTNDGHTISFTTSGIEKFLSDYKVNTPEIEDVDEHWVRFDFNGMESDIRIAYDTERSKLTGENIKNGSVAYFCQENMQEEILDVPS